MFHDVSDDDVVMLSHVTTVWQFDLLLTGSDTDWMLEAEQIESPTTRCDQAHEGNRVMSMCCCRRGISGHNRRNQLVILGYIAQVGFLIDCKC